MSKTSKFILLAAVLTFYAVYVHANCPDRWVTFRYSCYLFGVDNMHFTEAESFCRQHGGHLVEVNSVLENSFLRDYLTELKAADYWLGMTDETVEGVWVWFNSSTEVTYTDWGPHEPMDYPNINEDCAAFGHLLSFHWIDVPCTSSRHPACETSVNRTLQCWRYEDCWLLRLRITATEKSNFDMKDKKNVVEIKQLRQVTVRQLF